MYHIEYQKSTLRDTGWHGADWWLPVQTCPPCTCPCLLAIRSISMVKKLGPLSVIPSVYMDTVTWIQLWCQPSQISHRCTHHLPTLWKLNNSLWQTISMHALTMLTMHALSSRSRNLSKEVSSILGIGHSKRHIPVCTGKVSSRVMLAASNQAGLCSYCHCK